MGNAESAPITNQIPPQSQQRRSKFTNKVQQPQQRISSSSRRPVQESMQQSTPMRRVNQQPPRQNQQHVNIQVQLQRQQQQLEAQRRHQKRLEDQLKLQEEKNKMFQNYIEKQVQNNMKIEELESRYEPQEEAQPYQEEEEEEEDQQDKVYDPYEILGIDERASITQIRKAYKKRALQYHPDRGGSERVFNIIEKAYKTIMAEYEDEHQFENKINQEVRNVHYDSNMNSGLQNKYIDKDNFNINTFNDVFSKNRLDDVHDQGYGHMMNNTDANIEVDKTKKYNKNNFNVSDFNNNFNKVKTKKTSTQIMTYKEPEALISGDSLSFSELGQTNIDDFSSSQNNLQFTDYKKAHITDSTLIDPNKVKYKQYKNMNEIKRARDNIQYTMSQKEQQYYQRKKEEEEFREKQRQINIKERDYRIENKFRKMNTNMIRN